MPSQRLGVDGLVRAAIGVEPRDDLIEPTAQAFKRDCGAGSHREPAFGVASSLLAAERGSMTWSTTLSHPHSAQLRGSHGAARR